MRIAAIDIGTITTRLVIAEVSGDGQASGGPKAGAATSGDAQPNIVIRELARSVDITNLGEGMTLERALAPDAIQRVVDVVARYVETINEFIVHRVIAVATSATRDAPNGGELVAALDALGIKLHVISGDEEARLSFLGTTYGLSGRVLVADVGGGSTELIVGAAGAAPEKAVSYNVGSRRVTNLFLHSDPPKSAEIAAARGGIREVLRPFFEAVAGEYDRVVVVAGTATSLSAVEQKLDPYNPEKVHLSTLSAEQLDALEQRLAAMTTEQRQGVVGLESQRAPVIVGGVLVLQELLSLSGFDELTVSENDLLCGLVLSTYNE